MLVYLVYAARAVVIAAWFAAITLMVALCALCAAIFVFVIAGVSGALG